MLAAADRRQKLHDFFRTEDDRQLLGFLEKWDLFNGPRFLERYFVEKPQGADGNAAAPR